MRIVESGRKGIRGTEWCMKDSPSGRQYLEYLGRRKAGIITPFPFDLGPNMPVVMKGPTHLWGLIPNPSLSTLQPLIQSSDASITKLQSTLIPEDATNETKME